MPLSQQLKRLAEQEVIAWSNTTGAKLVPNGNMRDQTRILTAETLYRRMVEKFPEEMAIYSLDDLKASVFEDGDFYNEQWFADNMP